MEVLDCDKALHDTHQSLHQTDMAYSATVNDKREYVDRRQQPTIGQVVYTFLDNIKLRFGEESSEVTSILNILDTFRAGELSKKDTLVAIRLTLGDQADLKQDLLNILFHREAEWGVGDFDFGSYQPPSQRSPSPESLQPAHQPQMRLPPISPSWHEQSHAYTGHEAEDSLTTKQHNIEIVPQLSRSQHEWEETDHLEESKAYYGQPWSRVVGNSMLGRAQSFASDHFKSPSLSHQAHLSPNSSSRKGQVATASPSVLGVPVAIPFGQPINDMPPPSKKRRHQSSRPQVKVKEDMSKEDAETASPTSPSIAIIDHLSATPQPKENVKDEGTASHGGGRPYIHSLCGKGFSSRSKVKKHHWGNKLDNLETTTGCWAKNNKPNVSWNEHPSCKEGTAPPRPVKKAPSAVVRQKASVQKAPMAPSMVPEPQDVSQTVAGTPHHHQESQPSFEGLGTYHSHRLPTRTSFDNLLTAVNVASHIDAPQPQGRIDSVVSHLDAQATAAEQNRQYITNWQKASDHYSGEALTYDRQQPYTAYEMGLQGIHVPVNMALPGLNGLYPYTSSTRSFTDARWNNDRDLVDDSTNRNHATLGPPFSPGLDKQGRQF